MKKIDIVGLAFGNFKRRKTRSILSVLGVVIGTASIVTMMSLGIAMDQSFSESMAGMGDLTTIEVNQGYNWDTGQEGKALDDEAVAALSMLEDVKLVVPQVRLDGKVFSGKYMTYPTIYGINREYLEELGMTAEQGRLLSEQDNDAGKNVFCVMGAEVPYQFSKPRRISGGGIMVGGGGSGGAVYDENGNLISRDPPEIDPMDETVRIRYSYDWSYGESNPGDFTGEPRKKANTYNLKTLGVLKQTQGQQDYSIYIDMDTALKLKKEADKFNNPSSSSSRKKQSYDTILVLSDSMDHTVAINEQIKEMGYQSYTSAEWITKMQEQSQMTQMVLAGIGGVSLLVAAIGITNTMVMSIYERTREIGIMKVIGCYLKDIRTMFLTEAGLIGFFGGICGVGLSYGISFLLNKFAGSASSSMGMGGGTSISSIPLWLSVLAIGFAILVALIAGFFPARRAMRLSALEAMRN